MESNDNHEIPDKGETSDIPDFSSGETGKNPIESIYSEEIGKHENSMRVQQYGVGTNIKIQPKAYLAKKWGNRN